MVILKASHIVKPAEPTPEEVMYLSDCDQIKPITHAPTVYFYKANTRSFSLEELVQIGRDSLSKVLVKFYPLAGRLHWTNGGRVELHCNSMGALLLGAESDLTMDDFGDFRPSPEIRSLIPSADLTSTPIHEVPLLLIQITKLRCGGVTLGTGTSHVVVDGQSAAHFVLEWAKIARGDQSDELPFLDRRVLQLDENRIPAGPNLKYSDFFPLPMILGQSDNLAEREKETTAITLKLSKGQIEALKTRANQDLVNNEQIEALKNFTKTGLRIKDQAIMATALKEKDQKLLLLEALKGKSAHDSRLQQEIGNKQLELLKNNVNLQHPFSRFEAVCAHIWKCVSMARRLKPEQETVLFVTVDFRNRINPPLPKRYFGNAVMPLPVSSTVGELLSNPLSHIARKIRTAIEKVTDEYVRSYLRCIKNIPNISSKRHFHTVGCAQGSFFGNPNLLVTSWVGLPIYGAKFWGDEVYLGPGSLGYDGRIFVIPSQKGDGSFLVPMRLQVEHVSAFEKCFYEEIQSF